MPTPIEIAEQQTDLFIELVNLKAKEFIVDQAAQSGSTFSGMELDYLEMGISAGCGTLMEMLHERGWLNGARMVADMIKASQS